MKKTVSLFLSLALMIIANSASAQDYNIDDSFGARKAVTLPTELSGKGVLMGVVDVGIAFNHINFLNPETMKTRLKAAMFFGDGNNMVTVRNPDEISKLQLENAGGHGTHTSGIAAGSYDVDGWQGIAYDADLCLADVANGAYSDRIKDALKSIFAIADSLGMPLVINLSIGTHKVQDGYSELGLLCEELTENGTKPGRIIVVSASNSGLSKPAGECTIGNDGMIRLAMANETGMDGSGDLAVDFSLQALKTHDIAFRFFLYDTVAKTEVTEGVTDADDNPVDFSEFKKYVTSKTFNYSPYRYYEFIAPADLFMKNKNLMACVEISGAEGTEVRFMKGFEHKAGEYFSPVKDVYGNPTEMAVSPAVISVGNYDPHVTERTPIWQKSSFGINKNGEKIPDVVAPGCGIVSGGAVSEKEKTTTRHITMPDGSERTFHFASMTGTSQASPLVAGICALMLQYDPTLSVNRVRKLLHSTNDWNADCENAPMGQDQAGHGILNTIDLFDALMGSTSIKPVLTVSPDSTAIYDLSGRRYKEIPSQGIYIQNNKIQFAR